MNCEHACHLVDALFDGELDEASALDLQRHLAGCAACTTRLDGRRALRAALQALPRPVAPPPLRHAVRQALSSPPWWQRPRLQWPGRWSVTALATTALVGFVAGRWSLETAPPVAIADEVVTRHVAALASPAGVVSGDRHQVKPWLAGRLDFAPPVPDLAAQGFELLGARLERVGPHDAAVVRWRIRNHLIDLFAWRSSGHAARAPQKQRWRGFGIVGWQEDGLKMVAISDVDLKDLERLGAEVRAR